MIDKGFDPILYSFKEFHYKLETNLNGDNCWLNVFVGDLYSFGCSLS